MRKPGAKIRVRAERENMKRRKTETSKVSEAETKGLQPRKNSILIKENRKAREDDEARSVVAREKTASRRRRSSASVRG